MRNSRPEKTPLSNIGEFGLIDRLVRAWNTAAKQANSGRSPSKQKTGPVLLGTPCLRLGVGDDAAVIDIPAGKSLLTTVDMLVEGIHFLWSPSRIRLLGRKSLAVNISDIAAMGGVPGWAFLSIGVPAQATVEDVEELYASMGEMAGQFGVALAGGDTVRSEKWVINVTLLGIATKEPVTRSGGRAGDLILVTGTVGDSAAGLHLLLAHAELAEFESGEEREFLLSRHLDPTPRVWEAQALMEHGGTTAMMDVSDGISSEVNHICRASGCGAWVDLSRLPITPQMRKLASLTKKSAIQWALSGGEDYELLFTAPPDIAPSLIEHIQKTTGTPVTVIGRLTGADAGVVCVHPDIQEGQPVPLTAKGYNHFVHSIGND